MKHKGFFLSLLMIVMAATCWAQHKTGVVASYDGVAFTGRQ